MASASIKKKGSRGKAGFWKVELKSRTTIKALSLMAKVWSWRVALPAFSQTSSTEDGNRALCEKILVLNLICTGNLF